MYTPEATLYKPVPTSELGFRLRHLASGASPLCISDVYEDAYQMYTPDATFINPSLLASSVLGFATSPRGFALLYAKCL